jgi:hypothetical protein
MVFLHPFSFRQQGWSIGANKLIFPPLEARARANAMTGRRGDPAALLFARGPKSSGAIPLQFVRSSVQSKRHETPIIK